MIADTEEELDKLEQEQNSLPDKERIIYRDKNWERVFDLTYVDNDWMQRGDGIQATVWGLRKEDSRKVRFFTVALPKPEYLKE